MLQALLLLIPQRYEFSSKSQRQLVRNAVMPVVVDTTKVRIFKQITTKSWWKWSTSWLLLIPQRYEFSSKSQHITSDVKMDVRCCWYHKGTNFQANHNCGQRLAIIMSVVVDTTKVRIFKQITTLLRRNAFRHVLLLIPQRYEFSSKSQRSMVICSQPHSCCWYHKGTNFQANHNSKLLDLH